MRGSTPAPTLLYTDFSDYCLLLAPEPPCKHQSCQTDPRPPGSPPDESDLGVGFTEIFVKRPDYVSSLLSLLDEYDNYVRFYTVQVLTMLLTNRPQKLQEVRIVL